MKSLSKFTPWARAVLLALFASCLLAVPAKADVAPPESPPGVVILPGAEVTQVRMVSEVVTLTLLPDPKAGRAKTEAAFVMRNLGSVEEKMVVRFPLTYGQALYYIQMYPEIKDFRATVDGKSIAITRSTTYDKNSDVNVPWANFPVVFPPGKDVNIVVTYTAQGFGYDPYLTFRYILETGAGWKDTIGTGDIIVRLPYMASAQNVLKPSGNWLLNSKLSPVFSENEARWHFENLEPTDGDNFEADLVAPIFWERILTERKNTTQNPKDGEAWGRLGKAIKESIREPKGYLRQDEAAKALYSEAIQAYEKSVSLLPDDAQWHYGFADLLWAHYRYDVYWVDGQDYAEFSLAAQELRTSLELDPKNEKALELARWMSELSWGVNKLDDNRFDYLILTATPTFAPPTATEAPTLEATSTPLPPFTPTVIAQATETHLPSATPAKTPSGNLPFCGGAILTLPLLVGLFRVLHR